MSLEVGPATLKTLRALQREYGDIVSVRQPSGRLAYFINNPDEVRRLLVKRHSRYIKGPGFERVKMLLGNGLIVSDGDVWRRSRTMIQPAFKLQNVHRLIDVMIECSRRCVERWTAAAAAGEALNITEETSSFSLDVILMSIFGDDYENTLKAGGQNPFSFLSEDSTRDLGVVLKVRKLREDLLKLIEKRRGKETDRFDFLSMYMQATDRQGKAFSDDELLDELFTLIVAGFETSANTLNWAWHLLARHPLVEEQVLKESLEHLAGDSKELADGLAAMTYTQQVLEETLRLYPPVWLFSRRATVEDELGDYDVPPGTDIYLSPYVLHHSEHYWPQPERFQPERFGLAREARRDLPYFPFSLGPRRCLGEYFSFLEMKVHLGLLVPKFRMASTSERDPDLELAINLRSKDDILLNPTIRQDLNEAP